jgi:hypothetical protein
MKNHVETDLEAKSQIEKAKAMGWKIKLHKNGWFDLLSPEGSRVSPLHCLHHLTEAEVEALAWESLLAEARSNTRLRDALSGRDRGDGPKV